MKDTVIAEVGNALADRLRAHLVPDVIKNAEQIGLCSPSTRGELMAGIWLYDIRECEELRNHAMISVDDTRQRGPSSYVSLYYVITAYSGGDLKYQAFEEQRILGRIIRALKDEPVLTGQSKESGRDETKALLSVELLNLSMEDKTRILNIPGVGYKTSLFYEVGPVEIESEKTKQMQRVVDVTFGFEGRERLR